VVQKSNRKRIKRRPQQSSSRREPSNDCTQLSFGGSTVWGPIVAKVLDDLRARRGCPQFVIVASCVIQASVTWSAVALACVVGLYRFRPPAWQFAVLARITEVSARANSFIHEESVINFSHACRLPRSPNLINHIWPVCFLPRCRDCARWQI
jgi:hypothetical protein